MKAANLMWAALVLTACSSGPAGGAGGQQGSKPLPFTGLWIAPESENSSFELDLRQTAERIEGYHAVLVMPSGRIEVALPTDGAPPSVNGVATTRNSATVHYKLRKGAGEGDATLVLKGDKMTWRLLNATGERCLPETCPLVKQKAH